MSALTCEARVRAFFLCAQMFSSRPRPRALGIVEPHGGAMSTIVEYTDRAVPKNEYPRRIVSPTRSSSCCFSKMEDLGPIQREGRWEFQYRRCGKCGFTVRVVLRELADDALIAELRRTLETAFTRNVPDL
jgi:hypothetical protein